MLLAGAAMPHRRGSVRHSFGAVRPSVQVSMQQPAEEHQADDDRERDGRAREHQTVIAVFR